MFGMKGLSYKMRNELTRREIQRFNNAYSKWQSEEPHDQCDSFDKWLHSEPKQEDFLEDE